MSINKKKKSAGIAGICIIVLAIIGAILYFKYYPYMRLKQEMNSLLNTEYTYHVNCKVEGMNLKLLGDSFQGSIDGNKGKEVLYGDIKYNDITYLKLYANKEGKMVFDVSPLIQETLDKVSTNNFIGNSVRKLFQNDVRISHDQIEYLLDEKIVSIEDEGVSRNLLEQIADGKKKDYTIFQNKKVESQDRLLGDNAYYFDITLDDYDTKIRVGIPKKSQDNRISMMIYAGQITWSFVCDYIDAEIAEIEMPASTVSDDTIETLKSLYSMYLEWKEKQE